MRCVDMEAAESLFRCQVPDPRRARGVRHPFQLLRLTLLGLGGQPHGPHSPLLQDALAGAEGAAGFPPGPSSPATTISRTLAGV